MHDHNDHTHIEGTPCDCLDCIDRLFERSHDEPEPDYYRDDIDGRDEHDPSL
jgi:hypothetical protein